MIRRPCLCGGPACPDNPNRPVDTWRTAQRVTTTTARRAKDGRTTVLLLLVAFLLLVALPLAAALPR